MKQAWNILILSLSAFLLLVACSVKEDRRDCPCYTFVNIDKFINTGFSIALVSFSADKLINRAEIELVSYESVGYEQRLPRRLNRMAVATGLSNSMIKADTLFTRKGVESDPIWLYGAKIVCDDDQIVLEAHPHKQYCKMTIQVLGLSPEKHYPYSFRVIGECSGLEIYNARPVEGELCSRANRSSTGVFSVRILRQLENKLLLEAFSQEGEDSVDGIAAFTYDIGEKLRAEGYDWTRQDLQDVIVTVDNATSEICLSIEGWDTDDAYDNQEI